MYIKRNGLRLAYAEQGPTNGPALLFIHGYPLSRELWAAQMRGLSKDHHCLAPDLRGFGASEGTAQVTMDDYARDALILLDHLDIERAVIAGLSMGGYVVMAMWRMAPSRFRGLILADTRAEADSAAGKQGRDAAIASLPDQGVQGVVDGMLPKLLAPDNLQKPQLKRRARAVMIRATTIGCAAALAAMRDRPDSTGTLAHITVPALVIVGEHDVITPPSAAENMAQILSDSRLAVIPGAGHLSPLENARAFNVAVRRFLREV